MKRYIVTDSSLLETDIITTNLSLRGLCIEFKFTDKQFDSISELKIGGKWASLDGYIVERTV